MQLFSERLTQLQLLQCTTLFLCFVCANTSLRKENSFEVITQMWITCSTSQTSASNWLWCCVWDCRRRDICRISGFADTTPLGLGASDGRISVKCDVQLSCSATQDGWCLCCVEGGSVFIVKQRQNETPERLFVFKVTKEATVHCHCGFRWILGRYKVAILPRKHLPEAAKERKKKKLTAFLGAATSLVSAD